MPSYYQQKTGRNFQDAIAKAEISRLELAELLGVHPSNFNYWYERGVTDNYASQVAALLDLDVRTIQKRKRRLTPTKPSTGITKGTIEATLVSGGSLAEQRTVNMELLAVIAKMSLSVQQEQTLHSLAITFLGE